MPLPVAGKYNRWFAYCDSKLACLILALMLDQKFKKEGIQAMGLSAHPGYSKTNLRKTRLEAETNPWERLQLQFYKWISMPPGRGILPLLYAATAPEAQGGEYIGVSGFAEVHGDPTITRGQKRAYDPVLRDDLWQLSERLTGEKF